MLGLWRIFAVQVHILQPESGKSEPLRTLEAGDGALCSRFSSCEVHSEPCHAMRHGTPRVREVTGPLGRYNPLIHGCVSADKTGALELWDPDTLEMPTKHTRPGRLRFEIKSETHM